jgi:hypothetical protein
MQVRETPFQLFDMPAHVGMTGRTSVWKLGGAKFLSIAGT